MIKTIATFVIGIGILFLFGFILIALGLIGAHVWANIFDGVGRDDI